MAPDASHGAARDAALDRIKAVVGEKGWSDDPDVQVPYVHAFRGGWEGRTALLVRPASTQEVADVMTICAEARIPVVPQGGNTGLTGASVPDDSGEQILLSLDRMATIRDIDPLNYTITVDAGCILANIQDAASEADRFFPLSLGAQGSCRIGGNLSTNAGGVNVLRYGNARDLVLGLEVVLPDGRIWNGLRRLRKDNTGYDLKQLFVGGEGTLGIITGAVLKLFPKPKDVQTCFAAIRDREAMIELLTLCRTASGDSVTSFEYIPRLIIDIDMRHLDGIVDPMDRPYEHYTLIEFSGANPDSGMQAAMEGMLESAFEEGIVLDAAIAQSEAHRAAFWRIREEIVEASKHEGPRISHDVSVPVSDVPAFLNQTDAKLAEALPSCRPSGFGHVGDGNIHYGVYAPLGMAAEEFAQVSKTLDHILLESVAAFDGSFSAEHGIGQQKRAYMPIYRSEVELGLMRRLKAAIDPDGLMNPGKVL
ncbi:MAG: FAD-binding oxidoreductase [Rickettsiales bacterium]